MGTVPAKCCTRIDSDQHDTAGSAQPHLISDELSQYRALTLVLTGGSKAWNTEACNTEANCQELHRLSGASANRLSGASVSSQAKVPTSGFEEMQRNSIIFAAEAMGLPLSGVAESDGGAQELYRRNTLAPEATAQDTWIARQLSGPQEMERNSVMFAAETLAQKDDGDVSGLVQELERRELTFAKASPDSVEVDVNAAAAVKSATKGKDAASSLVEALPRSEDTKDDPRPPDLQGLAEAVPEEDAQVAEPNPQAALEKKESASSKGNKAKSKTKQKKHPKSTAKDDAKGSAAYPIHYRGHFSHTQFGSKKIDCVAQMDTATSGSWTTADDNKTYKITVKWDGDKVVFNDGLTQLCGVKDAHGHIQGEVHQEGVAGGSFSLKLKKPKTTKA